VPPAVAIEIAWGHVAGEVESRLVQEDFRWGQGIDQVAFYLVPRARSERT
jgi:hypothetical protein